MARCMVRYTARVDAYRAKERVMALVDSEHKDVQRHALQCVSKIMVNKWEFIR